MTDNEYKRLKDTVLADIESGAVKMRPHAYFMLHSILLALGGFMILMTLVFLASLIFFMLRQTGVWFTPAFGLRGIGIFIASLPWLLVLSALVFVLILELLVKKYSFGYRQPLLYSALGVIAVALVGGSVVARTQLHAALYRQAQANHLPIAAPLYQHCCMKGVKEVHPGKITTVSSEGFTMVTPNHEEITVRISSRTRFPHGIDFGIDDIVIVIGQRPTATIEAFGIRRIDDHIEPFPLRKRGNYNVAPFYAPR